MKKNLFYMTAVYYSLIFMASSGLLSYISLFYADIKMSDTEIGFLTSISAVIGFLSNPFWGTRADRAKTKNSILLCCLIASAVFVWLFPIVGENFWILFIASSIFYFFHSALHPLSDTITLEWASKGSFNFSTIRTAGSIGFAVMSVIAGIMVGYHTNFIFLIYSLSLILGLLIFLRLPTVQGYQQSNQKLQFWKVLSNASLCKIYLYVLVLSSGFGLFTSFHALYSVQQGINTSLIGIGIMVGSFSQLPLMLYFNKLYEKFGVRNIILFSGVLHALRWTLYAFWLNSYTLIFLWLLHGGTYILVYLCLVEYVHSHVRKELTASGQMMNFIVLHAAGRVFGGILGGIIAEHYNYKLAFASAGIVGFIAIIIFALSTRKNKQLAY